MASGVEVRSGSVDGVVDGKGGLVVEHPLGATTSHNGSIRADEQEVGDRHVSERDSKRVDPEVVLCARVNPFGEPYKIVRRCDAMGPDGARGLIESNRKGRDT